MSWNAVALGAMAAIGLSLVAFIAVSIAGLDGNAGAIVLLLIQYVSLLVGGYVAGRLTRSNAELTGGMTGVSVFAFTSLLNALGGTDTVVPLLLLLGVIAAIVGTAGAVLAKTTG